MEPGLIFGLGFLLFIACGSVWAYFNDKKKWNNGICEASGQPWVCFDMDSQGGRGYNDGEGNIIWISYSADKNYIHRTIITKYEAKKR